MHEYKLDAQASAFLRVFVVHSLVNRARIGSISWASDDANTSELYKTKYRLYFDGHRDINLSIPYKR